jgi:hypothetical protein
VLRPDISRIGRLLRPLLVIAVPVSLMLTAGAAIAETGNTQGCYIVPPSASTYAATLVEETTVTLHGAVTADGGEACQYRFSYGTAPGTYSYNTGWTGSLTTGQTFSAGITGLNKGTKYYFRAQLKNSAGIGSGAELSFLTKPDAPGTLTASVVSDTQIDLSWTKGEGAQRTLIVRKTGGFPADRNAGTQVYFDTGTGFSDTGLTPATTYYYRAWSYVSGSEQWSDGYSEVTAATGSIPPVAVGGVVYPVNKVQVLAPWLIAGSLLALIAGGYIVKITLIHN